MVLQPGSSWRYDAGQFKVGLLETTIQVPTFYEIRQARRFNIVENLGAQFLNFWNGRHINLVKTHRTHIIETDNNLPNGSFEFTPSIGRIATNGQPVIPITENVTTSETEDGRENIRNPLLHILIFSACEPSLRRARVQAL